MRRHSSGAGHRETDPAQPSEYEQSLTDLEPLLQGVPLIDIDGQDPKRKAEYLDFLAGETGIDGQHIAWLVLAAVCQEKSKSLDPAVRAHLTHEFIPAAVFFGWFRQGLPTELAELWSRSTDDLIAELKRSIEANLIPRVLSGQLVVLEATINQLKAARLLDPAAAGKPSSLGDLLATLPHKEALTHDQQLTFAKLRDEYGDTDTLWKQARASGLSRAIPALKRTLTLGELTAGYAPLLQALQAKADAKHPESVEFLAQLQPSDWIELVYEHGVPPGSGLDRDGYVESLLAEVERRFPKQMPSKQLENRGEQA